MQMNTEKIKALMTVRLSPSHEIILALPKAFDFDITNT